METEFKTNTERMEDIQGDMGTELKTNRETGRPESPTSQDRERKTWRQN